MRPVWSSCYGQLDEQGQIVRLYGGGVCGAIALLSTTLATLVHDDVSLARICLHTDGIHNSAALVCAVAGIFVYMQGAETAGTVIARAVAKRLHGMSAVCANKAVIIFRKAFLFHVTPVYNMQNNE